ncbi:MFS transporter [Oscillochloris sp. ZM17-4]|uniref:MFS transporter n=1 Tax=Oscillochloris sp. ZM17-4 TaxID=2866714 RepID=UPI001C733B4D|nr:MFS transporter [Oscillochloris sp. ZM17-4]MBX0329466.1 MFS transporter [Oscillochloris sp. ZM17-4]
MSATHTSLGRGRDRRLLIGLMFVGFISLGLPDGLLGVAWPSIARARGVGVESLGTLLIAFSAGYLTISVLSGRILAALGVGRLLAVCASITGMSLIGFATVPLWWLLLIVAAALGAGGGAIDAGLNAYAAAHTGPRVLNWLHACFGVGATLGPAIMTATIATGQPWQLGYALVGGGQLALAAVFALTRKRWEDGAIAPAAVPGEAARHTSLRATASLPAVWLSILTFAIYTGLEVTVGQWSFSLFTIGRGVPAILAGQWVSLYWGSLTLGRVLMGFVAGRVAPRAMLWAGAAGALLGALLIALGAGYLADVAGLLLMGLSLAPIFPLLIATTAGRVGRAHADNAIGMEIAAATAGGALIPWLIGQAVGLGGVGLVGLGIVIAATLYLACYAALSVLRQPAA